MSSIIAPNGSPLNTAIIGVDDLEQSIKFYRDLIGLTVSDKFDWSGKDFPENIWHLLQDHMHLDLFLRTKRLQCR